MTTIDQGAFYQRIKARMQERAGAGVKDAVQKVRREKTRQNIDHNRFDRKMWNQIRENDQVDSDINDLLVGDLEGEREGYDNAPELLQDLSYMFYKPSYKMVNKKQVEKDARLNRKIEEAVESSPYFQELRDQTVLDETLTTIAVTAITDAVRDVIVRHQEEVRRSNEEKAEKGPLNNEENRPPGCFPGNMPGGPGGGGEGDSDEDEEGEEGDAPGQPAPGDRDFEKDQPGSDEGEGEGDGEDEGDEDEDTGPDVGDGDDEFDDDPDLDGDERDGSDIDEDEIDESFIDRAVNSAVKEAADDLDSLESARKGIGLEDGEWKLMSPEDRLAMAERLNTPQIKAAAEMFGQMERMAMGAQATKIVDVPHEAYDVTTGDDIRDALGSEFALLDDPDTELEFYRRFLEKEMLVYKKRGTEEAGKGPIIVCIDKSGSMQGYGSGNSPFTWAMGVAEALRRICAQQDRDYYAMFFGNNNDRNRFEFQKGKSDINKILEFLSVIANGGTQFDGVLEEAIARVAQDFEAGREKADIVFITDGQAHLDQGWIDRFKEEKERIGCRVFGIYIGGASDMSYYGSQATEVLNAFSDVVIPVSDLTAAAVKDVFAQV